MSEPRRFVSVAVSVSRSKPVGRPTGHGCPAPAGRVRDYWGNGRIDGTVRIEGVPAVRKVRLFDAQTGLLLAETWSASGGTYRFDFLDPARDYFVLAHDHVRQFNAVVADWVRPEQVVYP